MARETDSLDMQPLAYDYSSVTATDLRNQQTPRDGIEGYREGEAEEGLMRAPKRQRRQFWWSQLFRSNKPQQSSYSQVVEVDNTALPELHPFWKGITRWYSCCIFGGISGLTILAILLVINLFLGSVTFYWYSDIDAVLGNWGKPGSGTEGKSWYPTDFTRDIVPIPCHSHNDYWRKVPLFSALRAGCTGVEADVWLFDDDLFVGHDTASLARNRTFQSLYIDPIVEILEKQNPITEFYNGTKNGVFDTHPRKSLTLLVDLKTSGRKTWPWVLKQLEPLRERDWLSFVENNTLHMRPVTVVGTGNTPFDVLTANATYRDAFFDAPLDTMWEPPHMSAGLQDRHLADKEQDNPENEDEDLDRENIFGSEHIYNVGRDMSGTTAASDFNSFNSFYASASFKSAVGSVWRGKLSQKQIRKIRGQIRGAHRRGLKVRYWDLPAWPLKLRNHIWDVLIREGVDYLNVDDLRAASKRVW